MKSVHPDPSNTSLKKEVSNFFQKQNQIVTKKYTTRCNEPFFNLNHVPLTCGRRKGHPGYHLEANIEDYQQNKKINKRYYRVFVPLLK